MMTAFFFQDSSLFQLLVVMFRLSGAHLFATIQGEFCVFYNASKTQVS